MHMLTKEYTLAETFSKLVPVDSLCTWPLYITEEAVQSIVIWQVWGFFKNQLAHPMWPIIIEHNMTENWKLSFIEIINNFCLLNTLCSRSLIHVLTTHKISCVEQLCVEDCWRSQNAKVSPIGSDLRNYILRLQEERLTNQLKFDAVFFNSTTFLYRIW